MHQWFTTCISFMLKIGETYIKWWSIHFSWAGILDGRYNKSDILQVVKNEEIAEWIRSVDCIVIDEVFI